MYLDPAVKMRQEDLVVVCVCDGYEKITEKFKEYATKSQFLDLDMLKDKGFMFEDRDGTWKMKTMQDLMDKDVKTIPKNCV
jgi:hypothetical protein